MFGLSLKEKINKAADNASDKDIVEALIPLLKERVTAGVGFLSDEDDLIVGYRAYLVVGSILVPTETVKFDWPYQPLPVPEAFKKELN